MVNNFITIGDLVKIEDDDTWRRVLKIEEPVIHELAYNVKLSFPRIYFLESMDVPVTYDCIKYRKYIGD